MPMNDYRDYEPGTKLRARAHSVHIDNSDRVNITGVIDVQSFNEQEVFLETEAGGLAVSGNGLHLAKLNLDDGQIIIEGEVIALDYEAPVQERKSLLSRMFR